MQIISRLTRLIVHHREAEYFFIAILSLITCIIVYWPILMPNHIIGREWSDFYSGYLVIKEWIDAIKHGTPLISIFWLHKIYGGAPAYYYFLPNFPMLTLFILYGTIGDYFIALKLLLLGLCAVGGILTYRYAILLIGKRDAALIVTLSYLCLSIYNDLYHGHLHILVAIMLLPLILTQWEFFLRGPTIRSALLAGASYSIIVASDLQVALWTGLFLVARGIYYLLTRPKKFASWRGLVIPIIVVVISSMVTTPLLLPYLIFYPIKYTHEEVELYSNPISALYTPPSHEWFYYPSYYYLGTVPVLFTVFLLPLCLLKLKNRYRLEYLFQLLVFVFCIIYASQKLGPFDITKLIVLLPILRSIRVYNRILLLGALALSVLCGITYMSIVHSLRRKRARLLIFTILLIAILLNFMLFRPIKVVSHVYSPSESYKYVKSMVKSDLECRVIVVPEPRIWWAVSDYLAGYIGCDSLGAAPIGLPCYPGETEELPGQNYKLLSVWHNLLECNDSSVFALKSTLYGVRYVLISLNLQEAKRICEFLRAAHFNERFNDQHVIVYENPDFRGLVFALKGPLSEYAELSSLPKANAYLNYKWNDHNTITINVEGNEHCTLLISYVHHDFLVASIDGRNAEIKEIEGVMAIELDAGKHEVILHFTAYEKMLPSFMVMYFAFAACAIWLAIDKVKMHYYKKQKLYASF